MSESSEVKEGGVAILDVLGVKGMWAREEIGSVITKWKEITRDFHSIAKMFKGEHASHVKPNIQSFSDTVILTYEGIDPIKLLGYISLHLTYPFCHSLLQRIFLRGVISIGKFHQSESLIIGPAIDEAAEWYEKSDWFGISLSPSASFILDKNTEKGGGSGWYAKYKIPYKENTIEDGWVLDWPNRLNNVMQSIPDKRDPTDAIYDAFSIPPIGSNSLSKYKNTLTFYKEMKQRPANQSGSRIS